MDDAGAGQPGQHGRIAGFWVRVLSDILDALLLGVFGLLLAIPFRDTFYRLGEHGVFVGLPISLAYAGVLQSRLGGGQTLGKRLLGLRVVKLDGSLLSLDRSLIRYVIVSYGMYQTAVTYALVTVAPFLRLQWIEAVQGGLGVALLLGCFLVLPFHPLKRGIHDLLTGTIVTRGGFPDPARLAALENPRRDRRILVGAAVVAVVASGAAFAISRRGLASVEAPAFAHAAEGLGMMNADVIDSHLFVPAGSRRLIIAAGFLPRTSTSEPDWAEAGAKLAAALHVDLAPRNDVDFVGIQLRTGYNIGIARSYEMHVLTINWHTGKSTDSGSLNRFGF
jgi:uncharacterized RDD family membrane protein YckC